jgi:hypothetical protein
MKKFAQFLVLSSGFMLTNCPQQTGIRVPLGYSIKRAAGND